MWTWLAALLILHLATRVSVWSQVTSGSSLFYFPLPIALVLTYWWGPRVLLMLYINATLSAGLWDLDNTFLFPVYALPEVIFLALSWLFFIRMAKGKYWLPDITQTSYFLLFGILAPLIIYKALLEGLFVLFNEVPAEQFWKLFVTTSLGDFISIFGLSVPLLYFFSKSMADKGWTLIMPTVPFRVSPFSRLKNNNQKLAELLILIAAVIFLQVLVPFSDYWFVFGVLSLYTAIRFGFGMVIVFNSLILLVTYVFPAISDEKFTSSMIMENDMIKIQIGTGLLYVFATVTGRVMSDVGAAEKRLEAQKDELSRTNKELDQFVYSVSHDLSAPLKSILGLANISKLETNPDQLKLYMEKVEVSVHRLEGFITDILDYSRNGRLRVIGEQVSIKTLVDEIISNLQFSENFESIDIDTQQLEGITIYSDPLRLKIIMNNLISNAIKFQRHYGDVKPSLTITAEVNEQECVINVADNGEGIPPEMQDKIFDMFFRGTQRSKGSGLGLYIAKQAALKINGSISVKSEYGHGSVFKVMLPHINVQ